VVRRGRRRVRGRRWMFTFSHGLKQDINILQWMLWRSLWYGMSSSRDLYIWVMANNAGVTNVTAEFCGYDVACHVALGLLCTAVWEFTLIHSIPQMQVYTH
jgi:hypothetical protein